MFLGFYIFAAQNQILISMCGIVGYIGPKKAYPILIKGLKRLEYRGYDSAGVALISDNRQLNVYKTKGKVSELETFVTQKDISGNIGIAHTRWATHGEPCSANAHPHYSSSEHLALIHNGIIENYAVLKEKLQAKGYSFKSSTDTEVLVQLIEFIQKSKNTDLLTAVQLALREVIGAYAIAVLDKDNPDEIIAARKSSPLVVGIGEDEFFLASDATPIVEYTDKVVYLEDEEIAVIRRGEKLKVVNLKNVECPHEVKTVALNLGQLEKGGYPHFMLKEIFEQVNSIYDTIRGRVNAEASEIYLGGISEIIPKMVNAHRIIIIGCGTSWHAGTVGEYILEEFTRIPVEVEYASEFRYRNPIVDANDIVIAISQSGETADTLAAIKYAKAHGATVIGICNVVGSSIARETDAGVYTHAGPEIGVASTKAFTAQISVLAMMALQIGHRKGTLSDELYKKYINELYNLPDKVKAILEKNDKIKEIAAIYKDSTNAIYLGRGCQFPVALEGALKLKEISYIHAEGYPAAEMKHGPIALIDENMPVFAIATNDNYYDKIVSNIKEIQSRKGHVIALVNDNDAQVKKLAEHVIEIPETLEYLSPLLNVIPLQLISYHIAVMRGCNVDMPRNLAKSVTVE